MQDKHSGLFVMNAVLGVCGAFLYLASPVIHSRVVPYLILSIVLHCAYQVALLKAYTFGGFLQLYPISRGTVPIVVTTISLVFGGVRISNMGFAGLALVSVGIVCSAVQSDGKYRTVDRKAVTAAILVGVLVAAYTLADGLTVNIANNTIGSLGLIYLVQSTVFCSLLAAVSVPRPVALGQALFPGVIGGLISALVFGVVFWAQSQIPTYIVSMLRETSIVFGFIFGVVYFRERFTHLRAVSLAAVLMGALLLDTSA